MRKNVKWFVAFVGVTVLTLAAMWVALPAPGNAPVLLAEPAVQSAPLAPQMPVMPEIELLSDRSVWFERIAGKQQMFTGNLTVEPGQTYEDDVVVTSGDVVVMGDGLIDGRLVVYSGNIEIQPNGRVDGDVRSFSGNVTVGGSVDGDISVLSGDLHLQPTARVDGDISVLHGSLRQDPGAVVDGEIFRGDDLPRFRWGWGPGTDWDRELRARPVSAWERVWGFFVRVIGGSLMTAVVALLVGVLMYVRPATVQAVRGTMQEQTALSFVVGLLVNLTLVFLAGLLTLTVCLTPLALVPMLALLVVNLAGWAAISWYIGERVSTWVKVDAHPAVSAALGAVFLTGVIALFWAIGGCFGFIASAAALLIGAAGAGAVLLPWLRGRMDGRAPGSGGTPSAPEPGAVSPAPGAPDIESTTRWQDDGGATVAPVAAAPEIAPDASAETVNQVWETQVLEDETALPSEPVEPAAEEPSADEVAADRWATEAPQAEDTPYQAAISGAATNTPADFTRIRGVGPVADQRLKAANVRTYGQLAAMTVEQVAEILGWKPERVKSNEIIAQAQALADAEQGA